MLVSTVAGNVRYDNAALFGDAVNLVSFLKVKDRERK